MPSINWKKHGSSLLALLLVTLHAIAAEPRILHDPSGLAYRADRIIVVPRPTRRAELGRLHAQQRVRVHWHGAADNEFEVLELPPGADPQDFIGRYRRSGHVSEAHVDHWFEPAALPDDPGVQTGAQWHLNNLGLLGGVAGADIHAALAWDTLNSASNIIVAMIDSGVPQTHQDLVGNLWVNPAEIAGNGIDDDGNGYTDDIHGINAITGTGDPEDDTGHGSHTAGIVGAVGNNGIGACGIAWRVKVMACKFLGPAGGSESSLLQCRMNT